MKCFSDWLLDVLKAEGVLDDDADVSEVLDLDMLMMDTDLDEMDIEEFRAEYKERCKMEGVQPEFDI